MAIMTEEILDNYVNECKEKIEETIKEFKKMWCDHYNDIVVNLVDAELPYFDYYFPFKYTRSTEYLNFILEKDTLVDSYSETLLLYLVAKLRQIVLSPFAMAANVFKFRGRGRRISRDTDDSLYDRSQYKDVVFDYISSRIEQLEKRAMFEWHLGDKTSTDVFNELFIFLYIAESIVIPCSTFEFYEVLTECRLTLLHKINRYELEGIVF